MARYGQSAPAVRDTARLTPKPTGKGPPAPSAPPTSRPTPPEPRASQSTPWGTGRRAIRRAEAAQIAAQLGIMVDAGVPLSQALEGLQSQSDLPHVRQALQSVLSEVRNGLDLSAAMAKCPNPFPAVMPRLLRAAEASGALGLMLGRSAKYLQAEVEILRQLRGALAYPMVMMLLGIGALILVFAFLLPRFEVMYAGRQAMLPVPTQIALGISHALRQYWIALTTATVVSMAAAVVYFRSAAGMIARDWLKLHIPLISRMFRQFYVARSFQTMGTMVSAGVTLPEAVRLSRDVAGNVYFARLWETAEMSLQNGQRLADPLFASDLISNSVAQMIATGERSSNLPDVMQRVASLCETELQHTIKTVTGMLEPLMIIVLGGVVGGVVMAILLPVFRMAKLMGG